MWIGYKNNYWSFKYFLVPLIILWLSTIVIAFGLLGLTKLLTVVTYTLYFFWDVVLYILIPTFTLLFCFGVVQSKSPINSLFCLISVFFNIIILLLTIRVEFLSMILLIIYIGAIAILFLFVIMLLNLRNIATTSYTWTTKTKFVAIVFFVLTIYFYSLFTQQLYVISFYHRFVEGVTGSMYPSSIAHVHYLLQLHLVDIYLFSNLLYDRHASLFLLSAMLLLVSMVGAIVLAMTTFENESFTSSSTINS